MTRAKHAGYATVIGLLVAVLGMAFVIRTLVANWPEAREATANAELWWLVLALVVGLAGMTMIGSGWSLALRDVGSPAPTRRVLTWYFPGQLGKYVPGGLWPIVGRSELAVRDGMARSAAYASVGLSLAVTYLAATLLAAVLVAPALTQLTATDPSLAVLVLLPLGLVVLHPAILRRVIAVGERVLGRAIEVTVPRWAVIMRLLLWHVPAWGLIGLATWYTARAFDPSPPLAAVVFATCVAWVAGFVMIGVPGGIGVREAVFVSLLGLSLPVGTASAVALVARLVFVIVDVSGAGLSLVMGKGSGRVMVPDDGPSLPGVRARPGPSTED